MMIQYGNAYKDASQKPHGSDAFSMPQIEVDKKYADVAERFLESIKAVYENADKKLSRKGIKPALPRKIRLQELPGKIGFEKYLKREKGKLYIFVVPNVQKVFGYYNPETDEAVIDPILLKDTEFSKLMKEYGLEMRQPSLKEVLAEETILHKLQKDAVAYPFETCMMKKILKEGGISPTDSLYGGHKKDIYGEFDARAADCYERGKCSCG